VSAPRVVVATNQTSAWPEFAGSTWVRLQYLLGLDRLGIDAYWVDRLDSIDPTQHHHTLEYLVARFDRTADEFGFKGRYCILYDGGERQFGMSAAQLRRLLRSTDLVLNLGGAFPLDSPLMTARRRAYVDVDPGYTQLWAEQVDMGFDRHDVFFTVGQNVGSAPFRAAVNGRTWHAVFPPVVLEQWPAHVGEHYRRFSTVADWRGSQYALLDGRLLEGKREQFLRFARLPAETGERFELALCIGQYDHRDVAQLSRCGWKIRDSYAYAGDLHSYRDFIQNSRCEFSVAKTGYVATNSGWISDRTACYLASGKPAIVQSTGFESRLPTGTGLLTFRTLEDAAGHVREVNADYLAHCRAARKIAEEYFDSDNVLTSMLDVAGLD
jgi:hypothetical protein